MSPATRSPTVTIVVPSYNHARFVGRAIDSALAQTYPDIDVVVIDDGSKDGSAALLTTRYDGHPRVRVVARENRGAHATINEAIGLARGDFVAILNSDDEFPRERITRLLEHSGDRRVGVFAITALETIDEGSSPASASVPAQYYDAVLDRMRGEPTRAMFWVGNPAITTSNFFFSRDVFGAVGPFAPLRYVHDWDWALRAVERFGVERIDEPLLRYRAHGSNTIAEEARWKKLVENAYLFGSCLRRHGLDGLATIAGIAPSDVMRALLKNRSFHPLPTLFVASLRRTDVELEAMLVSGELESMLRSLVESDGWHIDLLGSAARIHDTIEREEHLGEVLWHWRPLRRFRKVMRIARGDVRKRARSILKRPRGTSD
jgi:glycosyltransferase involved in cell wall biosynthesis